MTGQLPWLYIFSLNIVSNTLKIIIKKFAKPNVTNSNNPKPKYLLSEDKLQFLSLARMLTHTGEVTVSIYVCQLSFVTLSNINHLKRNIKKNKACGGL